MTTFGRVGDYKTVVKERIVRNCFYVDGKNTVVFIPVKE